MCTDLRVRLFTLRAEVQATSALIGVELEEPTMPWSKRLRATKARLEIAVQNSAGS
jgi:hypothetical protein